MTLNSDPQTGHPAGSDAALDAEPVLSHRVRHRLGWAVVVVLVLVLLTVLPPLLNVSRYQRRVAQAISSSIGRPVHFDSIQLHLLPLPGLTIQNFVVDEDPAFGSEPALRANTVEARLRLASLWRRRVEVSRITLQAPSINLVRRADGRWSLQGIVTEAGHLQNAPTAQGASGATPRFPYIEATDARLNIKAGDTKLPWSLLDAKLALWLPDQNEWRIRLRGRPLRTDTDVSDVGDLQLEGSLGRGSTGVLEEPLAVSARWSSTPLGEAAKLFLGRDTDFRGAASAELEITGTPAHMQLASDLHLHNLRRTEFVPRLPMSLDAHCRAEATGFVHALQHVRCAVPTTESASLFEGVFRTDGGKSSIAPDALALTAEVPDLLDPATTSATLDLPDAKPGYFLNWLRVLSSRIPESETIDGKVALHATWNTPAPGWTFQASCLCTLPPAAAGQATSAPEQWSLQFTQDATSGSDPGLPQPPTVAIAATTIAATPGAPAYETAASATPTPVATGTASVTGHVGRQGATLQYSSPSVARYAAGLLPPLGDNMPQPPGPDAGNTPMQSDRTWGGPQHWTISTPPAAQTTRRRRRR